MSLGVAATINDSIDQETGILVVEELGHNGIAFNDSSLKMKFLEILLTQILLRQERQL